jgi:hypothetical protein
VKPYLKITGALAAVAIGAVWFFSRHAGKSSEICDTDQITLSGRLEPEHFFQAKDCLMQSTAAKKTVVVTSMEGGNWETNLALGTLIHDYGWDVEVVDLCASSCAIFIFPAGKTKYLHPQSLLLFHGGPHQANVKEQVAAISQALAGNGGPPVDEHPERHNKEGRISYDPERAEGRRKVREFLGIQDPPTDAEMFARLTEVSDRFYEHLGVNLLLPHYGQIGRYEPQYKAYTHGGFTYRLESLRRLGVTNIEVKGGGEWQPERNPEYSAVYEVEYP